MNQPRLKLSTNLYTLWFSLSLSLSRSFAFIASIHIEHISQLSRLSRNGLPSSTTTSVPALQLLKRARLFFHFYTRCRYLRYIDTHILRIYSRTSRKIPFCADEEKLWIYRRVSFAGFTHARRNTRSWFGLKKSDTRKRKWLLAEGKKLKPTGALHRARGCA